MLSVREVTKKKTKIGRLLQGKMEKTQKHMQTEHSVKSRNGQQEEQGSRKEQWQWRREQCS